MHSLSQPGALPPEPTLSLSIFYIKIIALPQACTSFQGDYDGTATLNDRVHHSAELQLHRHPRPPTHPPNTRLVHHPRPLLGTVPCVEANVNININCICLHSSSPRNPRESSSAKESPTPSLTESSPFRPNHMLTFMFSTPSGDADTRSRDDAQAASGRTL
ncbi:hypothetical protein CPC08DRAFT_769025 [Agrocybe pediades]|nr:hypothetical protein CPC08DRAFT_769025 [Agrocybe pediades]